MRLDLSGCSSLPAPSGILRISSVAGASIQSEIPVAHARSKLESGLLIIGKLRRGSGFWNGVKLFAYSFENTATLHAFQDQDQDQDMTWSAYGYGALTFSQATDTMSGDFLKGGAGVFVNLAPYSRGFVKGSFRLAPNAPRGTSQALSLLYCAHCVNILRLDIWRLRESPRRLPH